MDASITIRRATQEDLSSFGELWEAFLAEQSALDERLQVAEDARERWNNDYPVWLRDTTRLLAVAAKADCPIGFVTAQLWSAPPIYAFTPEVYLTELYVAPEQRRSGVATALVDHVKDWATEVKARQVRLSMLVDNALGASFWETRGAKWFSKEAILALGPALDEEAVQKPRGRLGF